MGRLGRFLKRLLPYKEIGWKDIGETFYRYTLLKTPWFNVYLHELNAPKWHPECHDHPWNFITLLLWNGYDEQVGNMIWRRRAGAVLFRPAAFTHNVITPYGVSWSLVFTTAKKRAWSFHPCAGSRFDGKLW